MTIDHRIAARVLASQAVPFIRPARGAAAVGPRALFAWQWSDYAAYHRTRRNLWVHIVAVPLFLLGNLAFVGGLVAAVVVPWPGLVVAVGGVVLTVAALAVQGRGHALEPLQPKPFAGPANFVGRLLAEQWVTFPRFVLTGAWRRSLDAAHR